MDGVPQMSVLAETETQQNPPGPQREGETHMILTESQQDCPQGEGETQLSPPPPQSTMSDNPSPLPPSLQPTVVPSTPPHLPPQPHSVTPALHTPSPSSSKVEDKNQGLLPSAESKAFRKCSAMLIKEIQEPELLAWELYSDEVISETAVDEVSRVGLPPVQRKMRLLSAVRDQIAVDPAKFQKLHLVLSNKPSLKDVADKLKATYDSHCAGDGRETELKEAQRSSTTDSPNAADSKSHTTSANTEQSTEEASSSDAVTDDKHEAQPPTAAADEQIVDAVKTWEDSKRRLVLVTAGKAGMGKSTLINNLLELTGEKAAETKPGAKSVTKGVDYYEKEIHGITVRIVDTPGLEAMDLSSREEQEELLATLSVLTEGKADLMLYCMALVGRFDEKDERIVKNLTKAFGKEIWRHTILVLTYGDAMLTNQDEQDRELLEGFTKEFEKALKKAGVSDVPVNSILSTQNVSPEFESAVAMVQQPEIIGIPVGRDLKLPPNWKLMLFKEIIKKCEIDAIPAMLVWGMSPRVASVLTGIAGLRGSLAGGVAGAVGLGTVVGALGAGLGFVAGAGVGTILTGGVGAVPAAIIGAEKGLAVGAFIGAVLGGVGGGELSGAGCEWIAREMSGLSVIIKARQKVEELKEKKANEDEEKNKNKKVAANEEN